MHITRRELCQGVAAVALAVSLPATAFAQAAQPPAPQKTVPDAELMKPAGLPDMVMGNDKATVTIIEYASMTCPHCAHFQETTFPELKKRYIDTGKVRYIFREFPLDNLAAAASMLARCAGETDKNKYFALIDTLFVQQRTWVVEKPIAPLMTIAKQAGFTEATFNACLSNQKVLDGIEAVRQRAANTFKVQSTPTLIVNGAMYAGSLTIDEMAKIIDPLIKS